jgi:hypothetical protein
MKIYRPKSGNIRIIKKFALFPISTTHDDETRWLEIVHIRQCYFHYNGWRNVQFVDNNKYNEYMEFHRETKRYW